MTTLYRRQEPETHLGQHRRPRPSTVVLSGPHPADYVDAPVAACADPTIDPDLFFPHASDDADEAVAVCKGCPLQDACLTWAMPLTDLSGVWGGLTAYQRSLRRNNKPRKTSRGAS